MLKNEFHSSRSIQSHVDDKKRMRKVCKARLWRKKCRLRKYQRGIFIFLVITTGACILLLAVQVCKPVELLCLPEETSALVSMTNYNAFLLGKCCKHFFNSSVLDKHHHLNLEGDDVLIYLHIQKTGGATFGQHLVRNLDVDFPCKCAAGIKKCECLTKDRKRWLFSRHATGWMCGLHADWTELTDCVDEWFKHNDLKSRKHHVYHYVTILRNPINRFLSEWQHVQRGATWKSARLHCNGRDASLEEVPFCFNGVDWSGVTLDEFLSCQHNLAFNRMTRMIANLAKVNCYNHTGFSNERVGDILIKSAKENLLECAFFGIVEEQRKTQFLFEHTTGIGFIDNFRQKDDTHASHVEVSEELIKKIVEKNLLDIELYQFAKDLFLQRVEYTEKRMGYTVDEFFSREKDADGKEVVSIDEYDDNNNEEDEDIEEIAHFYPSKSAGSSMAIKYGDVLRRTRVR